MTDPDVHCQDSSSDCDYYTSAEFYEEFGKNNHALRILHLNIRSVNSNMNEFLIYMKSLKTEFHVVILTETWLNCSSDWLDVPGFNAYHSIRHNRRGGGVTVLVHSSLVSEQLTQFTVSQNLFEMCSVQVRVGKSYCKIFGVYRPPDQSLFEFNRSFFEMIDCNTISRSNCVILGDFNIDLSPDILPNATNTYISEFRLMNCIQYISLPTRVQGCSVSVIDHIWVNFIRPIKSGVFPINISDHYPSFICIPNMLRSDREKIKCTFRDHSALNIQRLNDNIQLLSDRMNLYDNLDAGTACQRFSLDFFNLYNKACPIKVKEVTVKRINSPWINVKLIACINKKHELYNKSRAHIRYKPIYKYFVNELTKETRRIKQNYFHNKFDACFRDIKKTWSSINQIIGSKKQQNVNIKLKVNNNIISQPLQVADELNKHYTSVAENLQKSIPLSNTNPLNNVVNCQNSFVLFPTNPVEVKKVIMSFKSKGSHLQSIPSFIYKELSESLSPVIFVLINKSFNEGVFPDCLKIARVIPIYKAGEKCKAANYRPISTLEFLSKIYERIMYNRLIKFFDKFNIICIEQYGFRHDLSTGDALLKFTDAVYDAFENNRYMMSIFLDFSKAFDTVDHEILIRKLEKQGIRGTCLEWLKSYLSNRVQYVSITNANSCKLPITTGVPQGSILGPLLFIMYINDMSRTSNLMQCVHYADDTTMYFQCDNINDLYLIANEELVRIDQWLSCNKLSLNLDKTVYMLHSNKSLANNSCLKIRNVEIKRVNQTKFLGIIVDDKLTFKNHIDQVVKKISRSCGILRKVSQFVPHYVIKKLYLSIVYPHLTYGIEAWGSSGKTSLDRVINVQNKCIKLVNFSICNDILTMYKRESLLTFENIYKYVVILKFYRYFILASNEYFTSKVNSYQTDHAFNTRFKSQSCLKLPFYSKTKSQTSFIYRSIKYWNTIPQDVKVLTSYQSFKKNLFKYFV